MNRDLQLWLKKKGLYEKAAKGGCACDSDSDSDGDTVISIKKGGVAPSKGDIVMKRPDFFAEHHKLIGLLRSTADKLHAEADEQEKEMMSYKGGAKPAADMPSRIDFEDIKWGSFTKQFKAYKSQHKNDDIRTLDDFANMILADPSKFQKRTVKRARFYKNIIKG